MNDATDADTPRGQNSAGTAGDRIKQMSVRGLVASAVVILLVGLVVGLAAGYKIEQTRVKDDVKKVKRAAGAKAAATPTTIPGRPSPSAPAGAAAYITGTVDTATPGSVSIAVGGTTQQLATTPDTVVVKASPGTASDITPGSHVFVKAKPGSLSDAAEVVVLPANAKVGNTVTSTTPTSFTITLNGQNVTVNTQGAAVEKVATARLSDITSGEKILAQTSDPNSSTPTATEIIVLPKNSAFVA